MRVRSCSVVGGRGGEACIEGDGMVERIMGVDGVKTGDCVLAKE